MRRLVLALLMLFAAAAGANAAETRLPVPPIPPVEPPSSAAPMPDPDLIGAYDDVRQPTVTLFTEINHRPAPAPGFGYAPGAGYQLDHDHRWFVLPGIMIHVPLP